MIQDFVKFAFGTFAHRPVRSWLTMLGIFVGIASVVALISIGEGLTAAVNEQFQQLGTDKIMISPGNSFFGIGPGAVKLYDNDVEAVRKVAGVKIAGSMIYKTAKIKFNDKTAYLWTSGMPTDETMKLIEDMQALKIKDGRMIKEGDKYKAVVGSLLRTGKDKFGKEIRVGDKILIEGQAFEVIGVLGVVGNPEDDSQLLIPLEAAREVFNEKDEVAIIFAQAQDGFDIEKSAENIKKGLRKHRNLKEGEEDFTVQTSEELMRSFNTIFFIIQAVIFGIAGISLVVGGIGIMNTMYTAVLERTQEIGVMKAVGARNSDIAKIFLMESGMLGLFGGAIGIVIGVMISKAISYAAAVQGVSMLKSYFPSYLMAGALAFSFIIGAVSGTLPALQAAKLKPVEALRYE